MNKLYDHNLIAELREQGKKWSEIGKSLSHDPVNLRKAHSRWLARGDGAPPDAVQGKLQVKLDARQFKDVRNLEDLIAFFDVDEEQWEVKDLKLGGSEWDQGPEFVAQSVRLDARFVRKWSDAGLPTPIRLEVPRGTLGTRSGPRDGGYTSVHYSDIHFPHHDPRALSILYQILEDVNPSLVVDHGDTLDCEAISKYEKDPFSRTSLQDELEMAAHHFGVVHGLTPNAEHIWLAGNHEDRLRRLWWKLAEDRAAAEVLTLPSIRECLEWGNLLGINELGWETVPYPGHRLLFDKLILTHGEKVRGEAGQSAQAEMKHYGKGGVSGHTHQIGRAHV